ncbi:MAG TPA: hypothetical protein VEZ11_14890 [Thermoanaerobaculia bacterium]|nr:hypothetical protein [Thermoanaerobaculia bacterium]
MNLDSELRAALRRESPPPGFAQRVMDRIERESAQPARWWRSEWLTGRRIAAAFALVALLGTWTGHEIVARRRAEGERARENVLIALRIAGAKVRYAQEEVRQIADPTEPETERSSTP